MKCLCQSNAACFLYSSEKEDTCKLIQLLICRHHWDPVLALHSWGTPLLFSDEKLDTSNDNFTYCKLHYTYVACLSENLCASWLGTLKGYVAYWKQEKEG